MTAAAGASPAELRACLRAILPAGAAASVRHAPFEEPALRPEEEQAALRMMPHRRREFGAGRACAREALAALGLPPAAIPRSVSRGPEWPQGIVGSITHTNEIAIAAVMRMTPGLVGIGIDVERIDRVESRLLERIATPEEIARLGASADAPAERALLFAARECVHKCWAPATDEMLVFADVGIEVAGDTFGVTALGDATDRFDGLRWEGRWRRVGGLVVAALTLWEAGADGVG